MNQLGLSALGLIWMTILKLPIGTHLIKVIKINCCSVFNLIFSHSYEIHMTECVCQKGLGKFMMQMLELIGHKFKQT